MIRMKRPKWLVHAARMDNQRTPKQLLYNDSEMRKREVGHQKLRCMDQMRKSDMKKFNIDANSWQRYTSERAT